MLSPFERVVREKLQGSQDQGQEPRGRNAVNVQVTPAGDYSPTLADKAAFINAVREAVGDDNLPGVDSDLGDAVAQYAVLSPEEQRYVEQIFNREGRLTPVQEKNPLLKEAAEMDLRWQRRQAEASQQRQPGRLSLVLKSILGVFKPQGLGKNPAGFRWR